MLRLIKKNISLLLEDELTIHRQFLHTFKKRIKLLKPITFNEKINYLKLYNRNPILTELVDKHLVRNHVTRCGLQDKLTPVIAIFDNAEEIDFSKLPNSFVIKCNHSWSTNIIVDDKNSVNEEKAKETLNYWLSQNNYDRHKEWAYRDVKRLILIENHIGNELWDYKFFCFYGKPHFIQVDQDRAHDRTLDLLTTDWEVIDCTKGGHKRSSHPPEKPDYFDEMYNAAATLSKNLPFCRVDFLGVYEKFYFGEITLYPGAGLSHFDPSDYDYEFGKYIDLSAIPLPFSSYIKNAFLLITERHWRV